MSVQSAQYEAVDFAAVLDQFASLAYSPKTARRIRQADVLPSVQEMRYDLSLASEAAAYLQAGGALSLGGLGDITESVQAAKKGISLLPGELLEISSFLSACQAASNAFDASLYPMLADIVSTLNVLQSLRKDIDSAIDLSGQVRMDATGTLRSLDRRLIAARADLSAAARRFIKSSSDSLIDTTTATVGGRLCVLVRAADKYKFGGMIHGTSQSGAASYLEPGALVGLNNEISSLQLEIEEEKKRICAELSSKIRQNAKALLSNDESLETIDLALAKGQWTLRHDGCIPTLHTNGRTMRIEHAVHPLLDPKTAVANTYELGGQNACLMITGSNTGGKTVLLKTIGLFLLLAHCGFPAGAHEALLPVYERFFFVIGDQQSIENSLSTFSAHISRLAEIVHQADEKTFALLDEIGNGTDPAEGSALAQAILENLMDAGSTVITSTHYGKVKAFGKTDPRVLVGSVEFDPETLRPTYRYLPGVSGSSYAFHIARQYGLSDEILARAEALKKENESETARQLAALEKQQASLQKQKDRFDTLIADAHRLQKQADTDREKYESMKKRLDAEYESRLDDMLFEKKEEARKIIRDLKKSSARASHEQIEQLGKLSALGEDENRQPEKKAVQEFKAGDYVHIETLNNHGEIQSVKKGRATVIVNGRRIQVSTDQLTPMKRPKPVKSPRKSCQERSFKAFPMELNLIGMHVEEGLNALEHYLDQAVYHRVKSVRIIHGMGTGALRSAVWKELKSHPQVKEISAAGPDQGGLGATLVELR